MSTIHELLDLKNKRRFGLNKGARHMPILWWNEVFRLAIEHGYPVATAEDREWLVAPRSCEALACRDPGQVRT